MLEVKNLSITYKSTGQKVFDDLSFDLKKGEILAIMGPSGCGKTTLLNAVASLLGNDEIAKKGKILSSDIHSIRIVFQESRLLPWRNVAKNIALGLEAENIEKNSILEKVNSVIKLVGLTKYAGYYPHQLSIGMKQRVNFARAIACNPDLLLLDEPFSALDSGIKKEIISEFKKIIVRKKITTIFVTHSEAEAKALADRTLTLGTSFSSMKDNRKATENILDVYDNLIEFDE